MTYVYCGDLGTFVVPEEILRAAGSPSTDGRSRFARAIRAWGRWMDICAMQRYVSP